VSAKQILVIDDEDDIRKLTQTCLEMMGGWQVLTAIQTAVKVAQAQANQPDAILLDVMMPDMDGPTTFPKATGKSGDQTYSCNFADSQGRSADQRLFAELGVTGVIKKPFL